MSVVGDGRPAVSMSMLMSLRARAARAWWAIFENLVYLVYAITVVALIGALGTAVGIFHGPTAMKVSQTVEWPSAVPRQVGPLRTGLDHSAHIALDHPERWQTFLLHMPSTVTSLLTAVIAFLLWQVARTLRSGDPFVPRNARRIFTMAGCVAGYSLIAEPLRTWVAVITVDGTAAEGMVDTDWPFTPAPLGFALLLAALGAIFRKGARLREDVEGLV